MDHLKTDNLQNGSNRVNTGNPLEEFGEDITSNSHCEETGISEEAATHPTSIQTECTDIDKLGQVFEHCIQEVSRLEMQRDLLIQEFLQLQEPMRQVVKHLRGRLFEAQRLLTLAQLDYIALYEDVQQVKRKLFATARACIQSQVTLAAHEYEVAQSDVTQEELKASIQSLTDEMSELKNTHQNQLSLLKTQTNKPHRPRTMSDSLSQCRQASLRLQRRLSGSLKTVESWYEPRLMTMLKRRQIGEDALRKCQEQATDLRARLGPLRENVQRLETQRASLEQRIALMEADREQNLTQHKENVEKLRAMLSDLEEEFEMQKTSKKILEELKDGLIRELTFLRGKEEISESPTEENSFPISNNLS